MIRAPLGNVVYWDKSINSLKNTVDSNWDMLNKTSINPDYDPQFAFFLSRFSLELTISRYSRGDKIAELPPHLKSALDAWELSNKLSAEVCERKDVPSCRDWDFRLENLNHYNYCLWMIGLSLALDVEDKTWDQLVGLIGDEGKDILVDRLIATRNVDRKIAQAVIHPKPYERLLLAVDAPKSTQAYLLSEFVSHWYAELERTPKVAGRSMQGQPYWYSFGDSRRSPLELGNYFGRWCIEAVAAVIAFNLDDSLCLGHEHYPGDLLRPNGPSTHTQRPESDLSKPGVLSRIASRFRRSPPTS